MNKPHESVIDYPELRAQKARLGLRNKDLIAQTGKSSTTISNFFLGRHSLNLETIIKLAAELNLEVRVEFKPIKKDAPTE